MMATGTASGESRGITKQVWGKTKDGEQVDLYTLTNKNGASHQDHQLRRTSSPNCTCRTRPASSATSCSGSTTLDGYLGEHPYFGALVGRYGNRIGKGKFTLDGKKYTLATNNGANSLHGGDKGFDKDVWNTREAVGTGRPGAGADARQPRRRRGLSRQAERDGARTR